MSKHVTIKVLSICSALTAATAANAQNSVYDAVGLGFGGSAKISPGGSGPTADSATDPFGANINIIAGGSPSNHSLNDLSVGVVMYYMPLIGNVDPTSNWQCATSLYRGVPYGDFWPLDTTVQLWHEPQLPTNIYYLWFHSNTGFTIGHQMQAELVCAPRAGQ